MSDQKELVIEPIYEYGHFKVCSLCPASDSDSENKDTPVRTSRIHFTSLRKPKLSAVNITPPPLRLDG